MWNPEVIVTVAGVDYTSSTDVNVSITYGKQDLSDSFRAGFASVTIYTDGAGVVAELLDVLIVKIADSTGYKTIFTGYVTDKTTNLLGVDFAEVQLTAVSPIGKFGRRLVGYDGYPEQLEGERIFDILTETASVTWQDYSPIVTWAGAIGEWNDIEGIVGDIDSGTFTLKSYVDGSGEGLTFLGIAELSGLGHLYETADGMVNYQDRNARADEVTASGYVSIPADDVLRDGINAELSTANLSNIVTVIHANDHEETAQDSLSISIYGRINSTFDVWVKNHTDAQTLADTFIARASTPKTYLSSFTTYLSQNSQPLRDTLISIRAGLPVSIDGLPASIASDPYEGFVEGWTWRIGKGDAALSLSISDKDLSIS